MQRPIVAIGLDAFSPILLEKWVADGHLPTLAGLMATGTYARQRNFDLYRTENSWLTFLQGCTADVSSEWGHQSYHPSRYAAVEHPSYSFEKFPPFYALGEFRVAVFDVPLAGVAEGVNGIQLFGWGTEANQISRETLPEGMMDGVLARHGRHPLYDTIAEGADGSQRLSYRIPTLYDAAIARDVRDKLVVAVRQRTEIIKELMVAERWDLLLCAYAEVHTAGHLLWHWSQIHPLYDLQNGPEEDYFLQVAQEVDSAIADLLLLMPDHAELLVFSPHGMRSNTLDLNSMLFLPEILYRWCTGKATLGGYGSARPPDPRRDYSRHWREEIWSMRTPHGEAVLESPRVQEARGDPLDWDPANWFRPLWPEMDAFCLPGYSEGLVRINVKGRDGSGRIAPDRYDAVCHELSELIAQMSDARSGKTIVEEVRRVRASPNADLDRSPADLLIRWKDDLVTDVAEHPVLGRVGPAPYFRSGGHAVKGFMIGRGRHFAAGVRLPDIDTADVTATVLDMLEIPLPHYMSGKSICKSGRLPKPRSSIPV